MNYEALCVYAVDFLDGRHPDGIHIGKGEIVPLGSVAVYIAVGLEGQVLYVGSVTRPNDPFGVRSRIGEHLRRLGRQESWDRVYILPLRIDTPLEEVRRIEGRVGAHLRPVTSRALPRLRS